MASFHRTVFVALLVLASCKKQDAMQKPPPIDAGPELPSFHATVAIFDQGKPVVNQAVVFHDADGTILSTVKTGADGTAIGPIPAPFGMVTAALSAKQLLTLTHVGPDANIVLGGPPHVDATPPPDKVAHMPIPKAGKIELAHVPAWFDSVAARVVGTMKATGEEHSSTTPIADGHAFVPYALDRAPDTLVYRLDLQSKLGDERIVIARHMWITPPTPITEDVEPLVKLSCPTLDASTLHWKVTGSPDKADAALYEVSWPDHSWTILAASNDTTSFKLPALPPELAGPPPTATTGAALIEASTMAGYEANKLDWLRDLDPHTLPNGGESFHIWMCGTVTPVFINQP